MQLAEIIKERIRKEGPISFRDFMEMSLYYPGLGYYTSEHDKIGKRGDYYTSSCITPVFGCVIGRQLEEMWNIVNEESFTIVEYGAGTGSLCRDILNYFKNNNTKLYNNLNYCIIEKSSVMCEKQKSHLCEKVSWCNSMEDIPEFKGCVLSNELVDNFSVHRVVMQDKLMEIFVDYKNGFIEILKPAIKELTTYFAELNIELPKGFCTEINLEATQWIKEISTGLQKGYVITIDYGYPSAELYQEYRSGGTLVCYNKHSINYHPYINIGRQDITSHVNFSALYHWGLKHGLDGCGYTNQANFLLALGFKDYLRKTIGVVNDYQTYMKETFISNTLLADMGNKFKVLIQQKGLPKKELLGMRPCLN